MVRKLVLAVSFALGSLPLSVYGIGLGDIKTFSALNQNFKGEIQLLSVPQGELDTMRVKLASREAFARIGAEYLLALNQLKFEPARRSDGTAVILVTSKSVIREPFLDFLVEVNWPNGRLVKEYTVLLDPPVTTKRRPAKISKPRVSSKKQAAPAPATPTRPATTKPRSYTPPVAADVYGPVAANTTAWEIASKLKPQGISVHQMMMALLHANPQAFVNNNINRLKRGAMLRVPGIAEIEALDHQEAVVAFNQQTDDWKAGATRAADSTASTEAGTDSDAVESQSPKVDEDARLQIAAVRPEGDGEAGASETDAANQTGNEDVRHELMLARENVETSRQESEDLKATVSDMESQVEDLNRLLTLKDEQLAQLRDELATAEDKRQDLLLKEAPVETEVTPATETAADAGSKQTSWLEDNLAMIAAVAAGLFGVGLLAALFGRNRKKQSLVEDAGSTDENILPATSGDKTEATSQADMDEEGSFLSRYSTEDLQALQEDTAEVDPVAEANVFIVYERYEDAQKILEDAMAGGDNSAATRYKMLEVYFATQNKQGFVELAERMAHDDQDKEAAEAWEHIQSMGKELDKFNPLFWPDAASASIDAEESELSLDLGGAAKKEPDSSLNEDIEESLDEMENLEFDLSSLSMDEGSKSDEISRQDDLEVGGGELELESTPTEIEMDTEAVDLSELDAITQTEPEESAGGSDEEIQFTEPLEDIEIGDEVDTKLELAMAYMEMGDHEGAMSILKEVLEDGTDKQISSASELISRLNS